MARAGRKRAVGSREPSGKFQRIPQAVQERQVKSVVLDARSNIYNVSDKVAERMPETSFVGYLMATGELTSRQFEAASGYRNVIAEYDSLHPVRGFPRPGDLNKVGGIGGEEDEDGDRRRWKRALNRYQDCEAALNGTRSADYHAAAITRNIVLKDFVNPFVTPSLRIGLNAIAHVLGLPVEPPSPALDHPAQIGHSRRP
jgi:hypothetical protein